MVFGVCGHGVSLAERVDLHFFSHGSFAYHHSHNGMFLASFDDTKQTIVD